MRLSAITDEISRDLDTALRVCSSLGVETIDEAELLRRIGVNGHGEAN